MRRVVVPDRAPVWPSLDGIRCLAIASVVAFHVSISTLPGGGAGVDIFLVLSGFLITSLLVNEFRRRERVDLGRFYIRRALRLLPALVAVLVATITVGWFLFPGAREDLVASGVSAFLYFADFRATSEPMPMLLHTWSLSLEEQFYVLWPFALLALLAVPGLRRRPWRLVAITAVTWLAFVGWRYLAARRGLAPNVLAYRPDLRGGGLLLGCTLGLIVGFELVPSTALIRRITRIGGLAGLVFILAYMARPQEWPGGASRSLAVAAVWLATAALVLEEVMFPMAPLTAVFRLGPVRWIGRVSYGLYLVHVPVAHVTRHELSGSDRGVLVVVTVVVSLALTALLHVFVEQPFLRMKERFSSASSPPSRAGELPVAGAALPTSSGG
jgi:peptidoglycan/LPS O-acetylase OafA/YrhL